VLEMREFLPLHCDACYELDSWLISK
jgi:hypothetical protein